MDAIRALGGALAFELIRRRRLSISGDSRCLSIDVDVGHFIETIWKIQEVTSNHFPEQRRRPADWPRVPGSLRWGALAAGPRVAEREMKQLTTAPT
jgi:hypothetical protein